MVSASLRPYALFSIEVDSQQEHLVRVYGTDAALGAVQMPDGRTCYMLTREQCGWPAGTIVYDSLECDYGTADADTRDSGIEHVFVGVDTNLHPEALDPATLIEALDGPPANFTVLNELMLISEGSEE